MVKRSNSEEGDNSEENKYFNLILFYKNF